MRKFFNVIMFGMLTLSLVMIAGGCKKNQTQPRVFKQVTATNYTYTIIEVKSGLWPDNPGEYTYEFLGGTSEQRKTLETTPFRTHGTVQYRYQAVETIDFNIQAWEKTQKARQ